MTHEEKIKAMMREAGLEAGKLYAQGMEDVTVESGEALAERYLGYPLTEDDPRYDADEDAFILGVEDKLHGLRLVEVDGEVYLAGQVEVRRATAAEMKKDDDLIIDMHWVRWVKI